jgi:hypothetical protein
MKKLLLAFTLVAASRFALADPPAARDDSRNEPASRSDAPSSDASSNDASRSDTSRSAASRSDASSSASPIGHMDNVEVLSADPSSKKITLKLNGDQQTVAVTAPKAAAALRVVRPGDKVRIFYKDKDESGKLSAIDGFTIVKPNTDEDQKALSSATSDRSSSGSSESKSDRSAPKD